MVEKRKPKQKRKVKKKQPTQKQKQTQRQSVTVNINTKDLAKKRKPRANANSNTNRVLSQFVQPAITIPSNMINPPTIPTMFNPAPSFNQPTAGSMLNPNPLQMGRNTASINLTGNVKNEIDDEQSLSGFRVGAMSVDSLDNLRNYPEPPSITGLTNPSIINSDYSLDRREFDMLNNPPPSYSNLSAPTTYRTEESSVASSKTAPTLSTQTFRTEPSVRFSQFSDSNVAIDPRRFKPKKTKSKKSDPPSNQLRNYFPTTPVQSTLSSFMNKPPDMNLY